MMDYAKSTKNELILELKRLKKKMSFGLKWENKFEEVSQRCQNELPVLKNLSKNDIYKKKGNFDILIEGDNYHALAVLNITHQKRIDVIYIDPPFNTGKKNWKYNNHYVDKNDGYRHSKWLSWMHKRLKLARRILKKDGVLIIAIDDHELFGLLGILENLHAKLLGTICIVIKPEGRNQMNHIMESHEYAIFVTWGNPKVRKIMPRMDKNQEFPETALDGREYRWNNFWKRGDIQDPENSNRWYPIYVDPRTEEISLDAKNEFIEIYPIDTNDKKVIWDSISDTFQEKLDNINENDSDIRIKPRQNETDPIQIQTRIYKQYYSKPLSYWNTPDYSPQAYGNKLVQKILNTKRSFDYPKSVHTVFDCIDLYLSSTGLVLDYFAGSGTTGHATWLLNERDKQLDKRFTEKYGENWHSNSKFLNFEGKTYAHFETNNLSLNELEIMWKKWRKESSQRHFIICTNNENNIAQEICYRRLKNVISGYFDKDKKINGLTNNLKYFKTGFVDRSPTDKNKRLLVSKSTEMLCLREDCFIEIEFNPYFSIYKNDCGVFLGIVYDDEGINPLKHEIKKLGKMFNVYVFSLDESAREDEFEDVQNLVRLKPIPQAIYNVYWSIFS